MPKIEVSIEPKNFIQKNKRLVSGKNSNKGSAKKLKTNEL